MHGEINASIQQSFLNLLGEQPLAAFVCQWSILDGIATRANDDELDPLLADTRRRRQPRTHHARLHQCQRTAARANA